MKFLPKALATNARTAYRVAAYGDDARIWVGLPSGPVEAVLLDVSALGCGILMPTEDAEALEDGVEVVLRLQVGGRNMSQLFVKGQIRARAPQDQGTVRVGMEFVDPERLYTQLKEPQWRYFNRRRAFRVPPADMHGRPLRAKFYLPGVDEPRSIALHDLSCTGLAVALRRENEVAFPEGRTIRVTFVLGPDEQEIELKVRFVHSTPREGRRRIGFAVDERETQDLEETQEKILKYVLERQRQLLKSESA